MLLEYSWHIVILCSSRGIICYPLSIVKMPFHIPFFDLTFLSVPGGHVVAFCKSESIKVGKHAEDIREFCLVSPGNRINYITVPMRLKQIQVNVCECSDLETSSARSAWTAICWGGFSAAACLLEGAPWSVSFILCMHTISSALDVLEVFLDTSLINIDTFDTFALSSLTHWDFSSPS